MKNHQIPIATKKIRKKIALSFRYLHSSHHILVIFGYYPTHHYSQVKRSNGEPNLGRPHKIEGGPHKSVLQLSNMFPCQELVHFFKLRYIYILF